MKLLNKTWHTWIQTLKGKRKTWTVAVYTSVIFYSEQRSYSVWAWNYFCPPSRYSYSSYFRGVKYTGRCMNKQCVHKQIHYELISGSLAITSDSKWAQWIHFIFFMFVKWINNRWINNINLRLVMQFNGWWLQAVAAFSVPQLLELHCHLVVILSNRQQLPVLIKSFSYRPVMQKEWPHIGMYFFGILHLHNSCQMKETLCCPKFMLLGQLCKECLSRCDMTLSVFSFDIFLCLKI